MDGAFRQEAGRARRHWQLYFASLLPEEHILEAFGRARWLWHGWLYTPAALAGSTGRRAGGWRGRARYAT
jgi:hypothetical protein